MDDGFIISQDGNKHPKKKTRGWELPIQTKEEFSKWVPLKDLKERNLVKLANYAVANNIDLKPSFDWWLSLTLHKRNIILSNLQKKYWRTTHKFWIEVQTSVKQAYNIDDKKGTDFGRKSIDK